MPKHENKTNKKKLGLKSMASSQLSPEIEPPNLNPRKEIWLIRHSSINLNKHKNK